MKDAVLITGANGHLAKVVSQYLGKDYDIRHLTTKRETNSENSYFHWDIEKQYIDPKALENCKHIVHLAGFPILKIWTKKNKQTMYDSRIKSTKLIFDTCQKMNVKPKTFISASAIGIYGDPAQENIHESSPKGTDWLANMACDWENAANKFKAVGSRVVQMRISLIFSEKAGFLKYNLLSLRFGLGLILGERNRKVNWIHVKDIARFIEECIKKEKYTGPYNLACEDKKSQENFIKAIRRNLFPYSIVIKIPMRVVSFFIGKRAQIIGANLSLETKKMKEHGFKCKLNTLDQILENLKINS